jgi:hypothetical protein
MKEYVYQSTMASVGADSIQIRLQEYGFQTPYSIRSEENRLIVEFLSEINTEEVMMLDLAFGSFLYIRY